MNRILSYCVCLLFLGGLSVGDIREKKIPIWTVFLFALSAILFQVIGKEFSWNETGKCLLPGSILLMLAFLTRESIGYGDGATVLVLGLWTDIWFTLTVVYIGILLSGIWGVICILRKKKEPMPFIPFLLLGMEVALIYA